MRRHDTLREAPPGFPASLPPAKGTTTAPSSCDCGIPSVRRRFQWDSSTYQWWQTGRDKATSGRRITAAETEKGSGKGWANWTGRWRRSTRGASPATTLRRGSPWTGTTPPRRRHMPTPSASCGRRSTSSRKPKVSESPWGRDTLPLATFSSTSSSPAQSIDLRPSQAILAGSQRSPATIGRVCSRASSHGSPLGLRNS